MTTRRQIIQAGAVLGAVAAPGASALAAAPTVPAGTRPLGYRKVAYDGRIKPSLVFAAEAKRLGADIHDINGDITGLYVDHLLDHWREHPTPVAGMTPYSSMFVLQMMATSAGMRVIYRAHHEAEPGGAVTHAMFGPTAVLEDVGALKGEQFEWSRKAARIVMAWPKDGITLAGDRSSIADSERTSIAQNTLVSWILAPTRTA